MADRTYINDMVKRLSFLPNCPIKTADDVTPVRDMFFAILKDIPADQLESAVLYYLGQSTPFFPMPGTLRQKALELHMIALRVPSATEAWGMVLNRSYTPAMQCQQAADLRREISQTSDGGVYLGKIKELEIHERTCAICRPVSFEPVYAHPLVAKTVELLGGLDAILTDNPTADRARFIQAYSEILLREQQIAGMVPEVREYVAELADERRAALDTGERGEMMKQLAGGMRR